MQTISNKEIVKYQGSLCEVLTVQNELLFVGRIAQYDPGLRELRVDLYKGDATPRGIIYQTPIKLRIYTDSRRNHVVMLYAYSLRCAPKFWRVALDYGAVSSERRQSFRLQIKADAMVCRINHKAQNAEAEAAQSSPEESQPCQLVDISLTGLRFQSKVLFRVNDRLLLSDIALRDNGPRFSLRCLVRRAQTNQNHPAYTLYGCSFLDITRQKQDLLCHEIFMQQSQILRQRSSRNF